MANNIGVIFFLLSLLLLSEVEASRSLPAAPILPRYDLNQSSSSISMTPSSSNGASLNDVVDDDCKGLNREDCLLRRSMVAHTDYIYTQDISTSTEP